MEVLAEGHTEAPHLVTHVNILQELVGHHLQSIVWPGLKDTALVRVSHTIYLLWRQTWNQSMVQQLMREGNILSLFLKESPMGLIARTTWRCSFTLSMKKLYMERGVASILRPCEVGGVTRRK